MASTPDLPPTSPGPPLLHRALGVGLAAIAGAVIALTYAGIAPLLEGDVPPLLAYLPSGIAWVAIGAAIAVFRPRVPSHRFGQLAAQYWSSPEVGATVVPVWFLVEGAGVLATVGYFLTGSLLAAITMAAANATFWWLRPSHFSPPS